MVVPVLSLIVFLPVAGAIALVFVPGAAVGLQRAIALGASLAALAASLWADRIFDPKLSGMQLEESVVWLPAWDAGYHLGIDGLSLVLTLEKDSTVAAHPFNRVHGLEVYSGRGVSGKRVLRWASIGGGVGFLIGAVIGDASKPCDNCLDFTALTYAITGMAIGLAGGAIAGAAIPVDKWRRVELPAEYGFPQPLTKSFLASTPGQILMGVASILVLAAIN